MVLVTSTVYWTTAWDIPLLFHKVGCHMITLCRLHPVRTTDPYRFQTKKSLTSYAIALALHHVRSFSNFRISSSIRPHQSVQANTLRWQSILFPYCSNRTSSTYRSIGFQYGISSHHGGHGTYDGGIAGWSRDIGSLFECRVIWHPSA